MLFIFCFQLINNLVGTLRILLIQKGLEVVKSHFDYIRSYTKDLFTLFEEKVVLAQGELISTAMVNFYLQECGVKSVLLPALEFMR